jgi:hypothetical protein
LAREHRGNALGVVLVHLAPESANVDLANFGHGKRLGDPGRFVSRTLSAQLELRSGRGVAADILASVPTAHGPCRYPVHPPSRSQGAPCPQAP